MSNESRRLIQVTNEIGRLPWVIMLRRNQKESSKCERLQMVKRLISIKEETQYMETDWIINGFKIKMSVPYQKNYEGRNQIKIDNCE